MCDLLMRSMTLVLSQEPKTSDTHIPTKTVQLRQTSAAAHWQGWFLAAWQTCKLSSTYALCGGRQRDAGARCTLKRSN